MLAPRGGCDAVPGAKVEWCGVRCLLESGLFFSCRFTLRRPIVKIGNAWRPAHKKSGAKGDTSARESKSAIRPARGHRLLRKVI